MKIFNLIIAAATAGALSLGLTACGDDEPDNGGNSGAGTGSTEIVTPNVPTSEGWGGNATNGTLTYTVENDADLADGEANAYYAFKMEGGVCKDAAFNAVFANNQMASMVAQMLKDGSWAEDDEDDDDDYMYAAKAAKSIAATVSPKAVRAALAKSRLTRAAGPSVPVYVKGNVVYVFIDGLTGLDAADLKDVINYWEYDYSSNRPMPDKFVFGTYNAQTGVYEYDNMYSLGIKYKVETKYDAAGNLTDWVTTVTCPNAYWAEMIYEGQLESGDSLAEIFGQRPDVRLNGKTVTVKAVVIGDVPRVYAEQLLMVYDWLFGEPFFCEIFN